MSIVDGKRQAWAYFKEGNYTEAHAATEALSLSYPDDAEIKYLLGSCLAKLGDYSDAVSNFKQSLEIMPDKPWTHIALARSLKELNKTDEAILAYQRALQQNPSISEAYIGLGDVALQQGKYSEARNHYYKAGRLAPRSGLSQYKLALLAREEKAEPDIILQHLTQATVTEKNVPTYLNALAEWLFKNRRYDEAIEKFSLAIDIDNNFVPARTGLLNAYVKSGDYAKAEMQINNILQQNLYLSYIARPFLMICKHLDRCDEAIEYAETCIEHSQYEQSELMDLYMLISKTLDQMKQYSRAWECLSRGKSIKQGFGLYDETRPKQIVDSLVEYFTFTRMFNLPKCNLKRSDRPIFIVGMPRSGTSLTEQILASHPDVHGAGELEYISDLMNSVQGLLQSEKPWPACITEMTEAVLTQLAEQYLFKLQLLNTSARYVTDKMPHNYYALGLIQMMFPDARVIHCRRDPMDTCLSIYTQNFAKGHEYANNLYHLGTHYHQYLRLMQHWRDNLSIDMYELDYELLVNEPGQTVAALLEFCNLEWNDRCMQFNTLGRVVETASIDQVRQPIHNKSISRWKNYEQYMGDLKKGLERGY